MKRLRIQQNTNIKRTRIVRGKYVNNPPPNISFKEGDVVLALIYDNDGGREMCTKERCRVEQIDGRRIVLRRPNGVLWTKIFTDEEGLMRRGP